MAESREMGRLSLSDFPLAALITASDGSIVWSNRLAEGLLKQIEKQIEQLIPTDPSVKAARFLADVLPFLAAAPSGSEPERWVGCVQSLDQRLIDLDVSRVPYSGVNESSGWLYLICDTTEHGELQRAREQLLYSVAHELRGSLTTLDNAIDLLRTEGTQLSVAEFDQLTGLAARSSGRLRALMEGLLSAGAIQSGRFQLVTEAIPLAELVANSLDEVAAVLAGRDQTTTVSLPSEGVFVGADPRYAGHVLTNLLSNASKYGPERSVIRVSAHVVGSAVRIAVQDEGPGIAPDQIADVFARYVRADSARGKAGVGLGLAIAKGIVEAQGGSIGLERVDPHGTLVWFTLRIWEWPSGARGMTTAHS